MIPVVFPAEMTAIDAEAPEPVEELIDRAGWATARAARVLLSRLPPGGDGRRGVYGRRVLVLAGKGNNGADGRSAALFLERWGVACTVVNILDEPTVASARPTTADGFDLVLDACFGTGLRGSFDHHDLPMAVGDTPVLAVDIPSGVSGLTGAAQGRPLAAVATVTFAALKPGLLFEPGRTLAGLVEVGDIGLDVSRARLWCLEAADLERWPRRAVDAHKWNQAVAVVGGSAGMTGAPTMTATAALRAGAGYAVMAMVGGAVNAGPTEAVAVDLGADTDEVRDRIGRCRAVAIGPGADTDEATTELLGRVVDALSVSAVFDAGALRPELLDRRRSGGLADDPLHVLTPHDGEFERLTGHKPGEDRLAATRSAAESLRAVVVLKGPTTVIAHPDGRACVSVAGDQRLATAGTGDVLTGIIAAGLALGLAPFDAAGLGVELHGRAARLGHPTGLTAGDLPDLVADVLSSRSVGDERSSRTRAGGSLGR